MGKFFEEIKSLQNSSIGNEVKQRLLEFESFKGKSSKEWFSELCFCLLTANSKAKTAISIQKQLGAEGFCTACADDVKKCIRLNKHRFHNNKTRFIVAARKHLDIKEIMQEIVQKEGEEVAREWLCKEVKGLGYKEASHFLRNVGYKKLAILDRHILNLMLEHGFIEEKPKTLSRAKYLEIEQKFNSIAHSLQMSPAELDLYMWYLKTGQVLK